MFDLPEHQQIGINENGDGPVHPDSVEFAGWACWCGRAGCEAYLQYGAMFRDGSVRHSWNGATQRQRAEEYLDSLKANYPGDAPYFRLVRRANRTDPWEEIT